MPPTMPPTILPLPLEGGDGVVVNSGGGVVVVVSEDVLNKI